MGESGPHHTSVFRSAARTSRGKTIAFGKHGNLCPGQYAGYAIETVLIEAPIAEGYSSVRLDDENRRDELHIVGSGDRPGLFVDEDLELKSLRFSKVHRFVQWILGDTPKRAV